ncbi:hypothetical protein EMPS_02201 [Entomortierella parvispora]|uniref:Uncharacterized protein n=1 Tax=Entomortierella parvispora TaxID=205924 RepID=A0A9P3H4E7_9FUNG|nr:hypothetical protein EMPS_02201 [Entomortierella parvispora]
MAFQRIRPGSHPATDLQGSTAGLDDIDQDDPQKDSFFKGHPQQINKKSAISRRAVLALSLAGLLMVLFSAKTLYPASFGGRGSYGNRGGKRLPQDDMTRLPDRSFPVDEKFLLMDYSPWLGFNNMRYMIERGLYLADLLNRTLVLPTLLRIRQCSDEDICAETATPLDLSAIGHNPQESTLSLDLGYFIDLDHLWRTTQGRVIAFDLFMERAAGFPRGISLVDSEFGAQVSFWQDVQEKHKGGPWPLESEARYSALDEDEEEEQDEAAERTPKPQRQSSRGVFRIQRSAWDLTEQEDLSLIDNLVRNALVDNLEVPSHESQVIRAKDGTDRQKRTFFAFSDVRGGGLDKIVQWSVDFQYQDQRFTPDLSSCQLPVEEASVEAIPWEARFPSFATCRIENYVGLKQELGPIQDRILSIEGQFHTTGWVPMIYSSLADAERYRDMSIRSLQYAPAVQDAAEYMLATLQNMVMERQAIDAGTKGNSPSAAWFKLSMHVRRGDFVTDKYGWQDFGNRWMGDLVKEAVETVFPHQVHSATKGQPPTIGFYMATDETSPSILDSFHSLGAILFEDLIDKNFEDRYRHLLAYDDWIGLVEQLVCAQAHSFYGTMTSSFTSGIANMRIGLRAQDPSQRYDTSYFIKAGGPTLTPEQLAQDEDE